MHGTVGSAAGDAAGDELMQGWHEVRVNLIGLPPDVIETVRLAYWLGASIAVRQMSKQWRSISQAIGGPHEQHTG